MNSAETEQRVHSKANCLLGVGLGLMAACIFLVSQDDFSSRYAAVAIPVALLIAVLAGVNGGRLLDAGSGRFILTFALLFCYYLSGAARLSLPMPENQWPWPLTWSTVILLALTVVWLWALLVDGEVKGRVMEWWTPVAWTVGIILLCGVVIKLGIDHVAVADPDYRTPDWLDPKYRFSYLIYRCVEYGVLFLVASSPWGRPWRVLAWGIVVLLLVRVAWRLMA